MALGIGSRIAGAFLICCAVAAPAEAEPVDLELAFINDVSGSITPEDYRLMLQGYADAFRDPALVELIRSGRHGAIAVSLTMYAERSRVVVDWMRIDGAESAAAFASAASRASRPSGIGNEDGLVSALRETVGRFRNGFEGERLVIDVVTEGADSVVCRSRMDCPPLRAERDAALASGVAAINALFLDDRDFFGDDRADIVNAPAYGERNLVSGEGSFHIMIDGFDDFAPAIRAKIEREVEAQALPVISCCH